ncbi:Protein of unknown function [Halopseudomonas aestusnigri]|uniref:Outer membrane lipoprotein-sorting protein n=2 Tax=Halopseudomonas aestusnigri TaxID=857252 RepID=A0AAQ1JQ26_9GAMM|nr:Protein of unknown function [Halopseudomonas aestusnigri]
MVVAMRMLMAGYPKQLQAKQGEPMKPITIASLTLATALAAPTAFAAVSAQDAAKLGSSLTPVGAEVAGNAAGIIPEWTGGLATDAAPVDANGFLANPYAGEQPLFVITAANYEQYAENLAPGQIAMFKRYPDTFKMRVFASHRSAAFPQAVYDAAAANATSTKLVQGGNGLTDYTLAYAFPIPADGLEVVWNHITRYRGNAFQRTVVQATPQTNGNFNVVRFVEEYAVPAGLEDYDASAPTDMLYYFKQQVTDPARLAGNVLLVHETINQVATPRMAWLYNAGQRRVRRAPQVSYDGPGTAADGMRTSDNLDMYNGAPDRYDWELVGKREMFISYNNFELGSPQLKYDQIFQAGHINQDLTRYELHRVWEVVANVKPSERHIYAKRHLFLDEDSWQAAHIDHYDGRGELWRVAEAHSVQRYADKVLGYTMETLYDLVAGRYLVMGANNEERANYNYGYKTSSVEFTPTALRQSGVR